jgi:hypothetical protein
MENRHGLVVEIQVAEASGLAERRVVWTWACRDRNVTPHLADETRASALDRRTTAMTGFAISQRVRKRVEEIGAAYNLLLIARPMPARS